MPIVVVGAGIVGASAAFHLGRAGADVVVVDRVHPGKATLAGAGIVCPWASAADDGPLLDLYMASAAAYRSIVAEVSELSGPDLGADVGYRQVGALVVADDRADLDASEARLARRSVGRPEVGAVRRIDGTEARSLFPALRPDGEALHIAGGARVDGRRLAEALLGASGARRVLSPALAELMVDDGGTGGRRIVGVRVDDEEIDADQVVVAAGAWTGALLEPLGSTTRVDVEPQKGQIIHLDLGVETARWPVVLPVGPHYLLTFDGGRVVVGATRELGSGFDTRVTVAGQAEVLATALSVAPGLADATIVETRVGLRPLATGLPTLGPIPGIERLWVGTGLGAAGLTIGPLFGRLLAEQVLDQPADDPPVDLAPFAPSPAG